MSVHIKFLILQIIALVLVTSSISAQTPVAMPPNRFIKSECDNSQRINVRFAADSATVLYRGRVMTLRQQPSGSGYRYADANWVLMGKGTISTLETVSGAKLAGNCEGGAVASGTVTYLPKVALPPSAVLTVRLEEVGRAGAPSSVLTTVTIPVQGKQVPISWDFVYDPNWLEPNGIYVVRAEITDGGRLIWTSERVARFQLGSDQLEILLIKIAPALVPAPSGNLSGTGWELAALTIGGVRTQVSTQPRPTLGFDGSRVFGHTGCNRFRSTYAQNANRIELGLMIQYGRECPSDSMTKLETAYLIALEDAVQVSSDSKTLTLTAINGDVLVFTKLGTKAAVVISVALRDSSWMLSAYTLGSKSIAVGAEPPTISFSDGGNVSGFSGCNRFSGSSSISNTGTLKFPPLASTRKLCTGTANTLETAFLKILQGATRYSGDADTLKIYSSAGTLTFKRDQ